MNRLKPAALLLIITAVINVFTVTARDDNPVIRWNKIRQTVDGFGVSFAFHQAYNISLFPEDKRNKILDLLFSTSEGAGISIVRNMVGDGGTWGNAADGPNPTIEPEEGVRRIPDASADDQVWMMNVCREKYGIDRFVSTVWSPPAWMKTNGSVINGGYLKTDKYRQYAEYLAEYVNGYKTKFGIDIYAISIANEPNFAAPYSSCLWTASQIKEFIGLHLKPVFDEKKVSAKVIACEYESFSDSLLLEALGDAKASGRIDIVGAHGYGSNPAALSASMKAGKRIWQTEYSNLKDNDETIIDGILWARNIHDYMTAAEVNAYFYWWGASYSYKTGQSLIRLDMDKMEYYADKRLFTFGNFSRFIRPGWVRIEADMNPFSDIYMTAYKDPVSGKFAIVIVNQGAAAQELKLVLSKFKSSSATPYRTSKKENLSKLPDIEIKKGILACILPAISVTTFTGISK